MSVISRDRVKLRNAMFKYSYDNRVFDFLVLTVLCRFFLCFLSLAKTCGMNEQSIFPRKAVFLFCPEVVVF